MNPCGGQVILLHKPLHPQLVVPVFKLEYARGIAATKQVENILIHKRQALQIEGIDGIGASVT